MNGNGAFDALHQEGFDADDHGNGDGQWSTDPSGRIGDWLADGLAISFGVTNKLGAEFGASSHIVTCYGIDPEARKVTIACSDTDEDDGPFTLGFGEYTYEFGPYTDPDGHDHDGVFHILGYGDGLARVNSITSFYTNDWQGNGASGLAETDDNCHWSNRDNWSQNHMPNVNYSDTAFDKSHIAKVVFDRPGRLTVDTADAAATKLILRGSDTFLEVLHDAELALGTMFIESGRMDIGGRLTANRADSLGGWIQVPGGTVEIGRASPGDFTASGITTIDVDAGGTVRFGRDVVVAPDSGGAAGRLFVTDTAAVGRGGTVTVDGSIRIGTGCYLTFTGPELQVNIAGDAELRSGSLSVNRSPLALEGTLTAGTDGVAEVYVLGAAVTLRGLHLGQADGSTASLILRNQDGVAPQLLTTGHLCVGWAGSGQVTQDAGTVCRAPACTFHPDLTLGRETTGQGSYTLNAGTLAVENLILSGLGQGTFTQNGGTLTIHGQIISDSNQGTLILNGGTMTLGGATHTIDTFALGADAGSDVTLAIAGKTLHHTDLHVGTEGRGRLDLADCTVVVNSDLYVGQNERGEVHQDGGTVSTASLALELGIDGEGRYYLTDGTLDVAGQITLGNNGSGTLTQSGDSRLTAASLTIGIHSSTVFNGYQQDSGTAIVTGNVILGLESGSYGRYYLSGTIPESSLTTHRVVVGQWGQGAFTQVGGGHEVEEEVVISGTPERPSQYFLSGGRLSSPLTRVGVRGDGLFTQSGGTHHVTALYVGDGGPGEYRLQLPGNPADPGGTVEATNVYVGHGSRGTFTQATGSLTVDENLYVGYEGTTDSTFEQTGGSGSVAGSLYVGYEDTATGTCTLSGQATTLTVSGDVRVGHRGTGTMNLNSSATLTVGSRLLVGGEGIGTLCFKGGNVQGAGSIEVSADHGTLTAQVPIDTSSEIHVPVVNHGLIAVTRLFYLQCFSDLTSDGTVTVARYGTLILNAGGTFDGPVVNNGSLMAYGTTHVRGGITGSGYLYAEGDMIATSDIEANYLYIDGTLTSDHRVQANRTSLWRTSMDHAAGTRSLGITHIYDSQYDLSALGLLETTGTYVYGTFRHSGGTHETPTLWIGGNDYDAYGDVAPALYSISAGRVDAQRLVLGVVEDSAYPYVGGEFAITDPAAQVYVSDELVLGPNGVLTAVPGAEIQMTGSTFVNQSTDPAACAGLRNLTLVFQGGDAVVDSFEVAGKDLAAR
jgi:T5SS/PEP-CTERM-associated repeat protein